MTETNTPQSIARRARRIAAVAVGSVAATALAAPAAHAGSTPRTSSEIIADVAADAVVAFEHWTATGQPSDYVRFVRQRDEVATLTANELGLEPSAVRDQFASTVITKQHVVLSALTQLGVPYRSLKSAEGVGFDCSGLTSWAYGEAGLEIPRVSGDQFKAADEREEAEAVAGDLMYYPGHVGIYLGGDIYVHSPNSGSTVEITMLPSRSHRFADIVAVVDGTIAEDDTDASPVALHAADTASSGIR